jgi:uncharacterized protein YdhG (YjbR/CyaY superfamily)
MVLHVKRKPPNSTKELLELINDISEVAECKIKRQKSEEFLYTNNSLTEKNVKQYHLQYYPKNETISNKLNQGSKNLYIENYKTLTKESEEDENKWEDILYHRFKNHTVKMFLLLNEIHRFKIPMVFFTEIGKQS